MRPRDDVFMASGEKSIVIEVDLYDGDESMWKQFQSDVHKLIDKYTNELAIYAYGFDLPETIDGSVVTDSGTRELDSVSRRDSETQ